MCLYDIHIYSYDEMMWSSWDIIRGNIGTILSHSQNAVLQHRTGIPRSHQMHKSKQNNSISEALNFTPMNISTFYSTEFFQKGQKLNL